MKRGDAMPKSEDYRIGVGVGVQAAIRALADTIDELEPRGDSPDHRTGYLMARHDAAFLARLVAARICRELQG